MICNCTGMATFLSPIKGAHKRGKGPVPPYELKVGKNKKKNKNKGPSKKVDQILRVFGFGEWLPLGLIAAFRPNL